MNLPSRPTGRILRREDAGLWLDGYALLSAAQVEAQRLRDDAGQCQADARAEGYAHGLAEGRAHMAAALAQHQQRLDHWLADIEPAVADLALNIARELIGELAPRERLLALTRQALSGFRQGQALALHVPPAEVEPVRQHMAQAGLGVSVEGDDLLQPGQARLASPQGSVELGVHEQLQQLRLALLPFAEQEPGQ
ncbi:type III secretion system stator protein SctL [Pseudomonas sp. NPDC007930]|uniref:type III secretion system stator protein SctL n=1 Tax=Pseudomonas sp. NPDC007930 TaxID=3364417 RepID=UPI0036E7F654